MSSRIETHGETGDWHEDYGLGEELQVPLNDADEPEDKDVFGTANKKPDIKRVGSCAAVMGGAGGDIQVGRCNSYALFRGSEDEKGLAGAAEAVRKEEDLFPDEGDAGGATEVSAAHRRRPAPGDGAPIGSHGGDVQMGRKDSMALFRGDSCGPSDFAKAAEEVRKEGSSCLPTRRVSEDSLGALEF